MQITIDSDQPLEDVLRVIGAMYNVDLTSTNASSKAGARRVPQQRRGPRRRSARQASTAEVRAWALSNGYEVGTKGRIADAVLRAYRASR